MKRAAPLVFLAIATCNRYGTDRSTGYSGSPAKVDIMDVPVKGFPIEIETAHGEVDGELLAVERDRVYVLTKDGGVSTVTAAETIKATVEVYPSRSAPAIVWTILGTLSTLTHGFFLIFTAPTWAAVGIGASLEEGEKYVKVEGNDVPKLWQFARYPAGMPRPRPPPAPAPVPEDAGTFQAVPDAGAD
jgi:hypothetical protein